MANALHIPGFAVLCRVSFPAPRTEGAGYFCALAVPAMDEDEARAKAAAFLDLDAEDTLSVEDTRPLSLAESDGLTTIRLLGQKVRFQPEGDA